MERIRERAGVYYRSWRAEAPKAAFLLVHGLGGHSGRWEFFADFFLKRGVSSYAIELTGFGEAPGLKGHVDSFDAYFRDMAALNGIVTGESSGAKIFLAGESLGGLISFLFLLRHPELFAGFVCISPAFKSKMKLPFSAYLKMLAPVFYNPKKQFNINFDSKVCTRDPVYQKIMDSNPLEHRLASSRLLVEILAGQTKAARLSKKLKIPTLFLVAGNDKMVDTKASKEIFLNLGSGDKSFNEYPDMYHALSIELGREKVFEDISGWLDKRR